MDEETVAAAGTVEQPPAETLAETPKPTTADIVKAARAELAKPAVAKPATDAAADDKATDKKPAGDEKPPEFYTAAEYANLDLRTADLNKVQPELRATFKAMQSAERAKHERLNRELKAIEDKKSAAPLKSEEEEDQLFTDDEIDKMLGSKKGQAKMDKWAADRGLDFEQVKAESEQRLIRNAVGDATVKHAELRDEKFFDETADAIANDEEWSEAFRVNHGNRKVMGLIFEAAAASVKLARAAMKAAEVTKEKETAAKKKEEIKTQKETANARNQVTSIPIRKPGSGGLRTTFDVLQDVKAARKSI